MEINKEKNFISAVVYVHNNDEMIEYFFQQLQSVLHQYFEKYEIICVDDDSTDRSIEMIKKSALKFGKNIFSIIHMSFYQGLELAMNAGVDLAIGDFVFEFDSCYIDYDIEIISNIYFHALNGYDIVSTKRPKNNFISNLFYILYNKYSHTQYNLVTESFRILSRRAINRINSMSKTVPYRKAVYCNCGLKIDAIVYYPNQNHRYQKVKMNERIDMALNTFILYTNITYRISMSLTMVMMLATLSGIIYTIIIYILKKPLAGYTTTMLVLTGSFFGVFSILSIIVKYLSVLTGLVFKKQKYIVESIEKLPVNKDGT
jgi:dolichol-phosphate mannosyltransferase